MTDAMLIGLVTVVGVVILVPFKRSLNTFGAVFLAPIMGTTVYVVSSVLLVSANAFSVARVLAMTSAAAVVVASIWWATEKPKWPEYRALLWQIAIAAGSVLALAGLVQVFALTRVSFDSFWYLMAGSSLEQHGAMGSVPFSFNEILKRQLVVPAIHAGGVFTGRGYLVSWIPIVTASALLSTAWIAWHGGAMFGAARRWRVLIIGMTVAFVVSANQFLFHAFYINGHMIFSAFLLVAIGLSWYASASGNWRLLIPASAAFVALVPLRAEALIVIVIFVLPIITMNDKPRWARWVPAAPIAVVTVLWYGWAIQGGLPSVSIDDRATVFGNLFLAGALLVLSAISGIDWLRPLVRVTPLMPLFAILTATVAQMLLGFDVVWRTLSAMAVNMATEGLWGTFWWIAPVIVVGSYIAIEFPFQRYFLIPLVTYAMALPFFAYLRDSPYRVGFGDSGNRMMMHIVLVIALYVMLAGIKAASETYSERSVGSP